VEIMGKYFWNKLIIFFIATISSGSLFSMKKIKCSLCKGKVNSVMWEQHKIWCPKVRKSIRSQIRIEEQIKEVDIDRIKEEASRFFLNKKKKIVRAKAIIMFEGLMELGLYNGKNNLFIKHARFVQAIYPGYDALGFMKYLPK